MGECARAHHHRVHPTPLPLPLCCRWLLGAGGGAPSDPRPFWFAAARAAAAKRESGGRKHIRSGRKAHPQWQEKFKNAPIFHTRISSEISRNQTI